MTTQSTLQAAQLRGKVAVITGAASGIGLAMAMVAARHGMHVALADIDETALERARVQVAELGVATIAVRTDVRQLSELEKLRDQTIAKLGRPWLIANNAGITKVALTWDHTEADWKRMFDINVGGVVNGLLAFLPELRAHDDGHIINTSSVAGLLTLPGTAAYVASKHAVVGLSETLYRELAATGSKVGLSLLCPGMVNTNIMHTPRELGGEGAPTPTSALNSAHALEPADVANQVFDAVLQRRFWILTHAQQMQPFMRARTEQALAQQNPDLHSIDPDGARSTGKVVGVDFVKTQ